MVNRYIKGLLHPAGGHQGSHKAHQAGNQLLALKPNQMTRYRPWWPECTHDDEDEEHDEDA